MNILILGAMEQEIVPFLEENEFELNNYLNLEVFQKRFKNHDVFVVKTKIGKVNSSYFLTKALQVIKDVDLIINIGSSGGIKSQVSIGDFVLCDTLNYFDVDVTAFSYKLGQVPGEIENYKTSDKYNLVCEKVLKKLKYNYKKGLCLTGDSFVNSQEKVKEIISNFEDVFCLEMEACALSQVLEKEGIPLIALKNISDYADSSADFDIYENLGNVGYKNKEFLNSLISEL